ncbi:MAG: WG repeat-containing protein [Bacteroidia bacterium]
MVKSVVFIVLLMLSPLFWRGAGSVAFASTIDKAYKALYEYDYFKAKKLFYAQLKKHTPEAAFGLATIYYRHDNPFYKLDSAYKYMLICKGSYKNVSPKKILKLKAMYHLNDSCMDALHDSICQKAYLVFLTNPTVQSAEKYATIYYQSKYVNTVLCKRDSIVFNKIKDNVISTKITDYIKTYPQSCYLQNALRLLEFAIYQEITSPATDSAYLSYIKQYSHTKYTQQAKEELLAYYIQHKNSSGIYYYIKNIKPSYYAWNALFSLEVKDYTEKNLHLFLEKYPDYPDKQQLEEEFIYWKTPLLSIKQKGKYGFSDSTGRVCIEPVYDDVEDFNEGFALVEKDNLYGYINKAGRVKIGFNYKNASSFNHQVAIVQQNNGVYLIDHAAKQLSTEYDEIADFTDNIAIVKSNNLFGAINYNGEEVIKPNFSYLSDFSENMAAFMQNNKYGFINKQGYAVIAPIFNWVSSFKNNQCRVKIDSHLGVINKKGDFIIEPIYDFIDESYKGIYLVVKNNLYGFIDSSGCFLSEIKYTYNPALKTTDLTNGELMRLTKNNKEELQDKNGIKHFSQDNLSQMQLCDNDIIAALKNNKYQFYSINKTPLTKASLNKISTDKKYWYCKNDKGCSAFSLNLKEKLFSIQADEIKLISNTIFSYTTDDGTGLINKNGTILLESFFDEVSPTLLPSIFYIERKEKGAYFNVNTLKFIWQENGFNPAYIADE